MMLKKPTLIVVVGPTAVGKTAMAIKIAKHLNAEIISCDSRQFYKEIPIGTAAPTEIEREDIKHHFVGHKSVTDYYNVSMFEQDVLKLLEKSFDLNDNMVMVGGSGLYIDAVCKGIDNLPDADEKLREELNQLYKAQGIISLQEKLKELDFDYYNIVDLNNPKRLLRAIEVCLQTGKPYSQLRIGNEIERPFNIIKIGLAIPREQLNERIECRLEKMLNEGWIEEVISVAEHRDNNALNTVGYKELFKFIDGDWTLEFATEKIKVNTRRYAKRQMTWFKRDTEINWFSPNDEKNIFALIDNTLSN